ncbi:MAG: DUF134 domain-containing protein [Nanoarchaeota archaeon]|nr:DUF134 domain-containing protein [Nanoarchaeota archaeon]
MPRPIICRRVWFQPGVTYFKPAGIRITGLNEVVLTMGEFEAIRLKDFEVIDQEKAAKKMNISQPTFHRLILSARKKIADALVNGKAIRIEGGNYKMVQQPIQPGMGRGIGRGRGMGGGRGRMGGPFAAGPGGMCKCTRCDYEEPQIRGQPCMSKKCPKCGAPMVRG